MKTLSLYNKFKTLVESSKKLLIKNSNKYPEYEAAAKKLSAHAFLKSNHKIDDSKQELELLLDYHKDALERAVSNYKKGLKEGSSELMTNSLDVLSDYTFFALDTLQPHLEEITATEKVEDSLIDFLFLDSVSMKNTGEFSAQESRVEYDLPDESEVGIEECSLDESSKFSGNLEGILESYSNKEPKTKNDLQQIYIFLHDETFEADKTSLSASFFCEI